MKHRKSSPEFKVGEKVECAEMDFTGTITSVHFCYHIKDSEGHMHYFIHEYKLERGQ